MLKGQNCCSWTYKDKYSVEVVYTLARLCLRGVTLGWTVEGVATSYFRYLAFQVAKSDCRI